MSKNDKMTAFDYPPHIKQSQPLSKVENRYLPCRMQLGIRMRQEHDQKYVLFTYEARCGCV